MKIKTIIAILLIAVSLAGMFFWESTGRERFLTTEVLAAAEDIPSGKTIGLTDLTAVRFPSSNLPAESLSINDADRLVGMCAKVDIPRNMPLASSYFTSAGQEFTRGQSIYVIPASWLCDASSSLRAGDRVSIYLTPDMTYLGCYRVAFVKDDSSAEVTDEGADSELARSAEPDVARVEIICTLAQYKRMYEAVECVPELTAEYGTEAVPQAKLLLVQEMSE